MLCYAEWDSLYFFFSLYLPSLYLFSLISSLLLLILVFAGAGALIYMHMSIFELGMKKENYTRTDENLRKKGKEQQNAIIAQNVMLMLVVEQGDTTTKTRHITMNGIDLSCRMAKDKRIFHRNQYSSHICIYIHAMPDSSKMSKFWKWWNTKCVKCTFYMLPYAHNNHFRVVLSN